MKGIINKGIQEMLEKNYGAQAWAQVRSLAGCEEPFFAISLDYPDESTLALIQAAARHLDLPAETVMVEYGKFILPNTLKTHYPAYFKLLGTSPREFLLNMDRIHAQATRTIAKAVPPRFEYESLPDGRLRMHYSSRRGLCAVLRGLIIGVGIYCNRSVEVQEIACMHKGDSRCTMEVSFP